MKRRNVSLRKQHPLFPFFLWHGLFYTVLFNLIRLSVQENASLFGLFCLSRAKRFTVPVYDSNFYDRSATLTIVGDYIIFTDKNIFRGFTQLKTYENGDFIRTGTLVLL